MILLLEVLGVLQEFHGPFSGILRFFNGLDDDDYNNSNSNSNNNKTIIVLLFCLCLICLLEEYYCFLDGVEERMTNTLQDLGKI